MEIICPRPTAIPTVGLFNCPINIGQIQRFIFQRQGWVFDSTDDTDIKLLASWTPLIIATDDTKIISTPKMAGITIPAGEAKTEGGGDNSTIDGVELIVGVGPITVTGQMQGLPAKIRKQLKTALGPEEDLVVYMINQYGHIICKNFDPANTAVTKYEGLPISGRVFVSDPSNDGFATVDKTTIRFSFSEGWADQLAIVSPTDFNAKTALFPAS